MRLAWYFTTRLFVNTSVQSQDVRNTVALYPAGTPMRTRTLAIEWLIGDPINPWTVLYAGSSEGYARAGVQPLLGEQRTYYLKASDDVRP